MKKVSLTISLLIALTFTALLPNALGTVPISEFQARYSTNLPLIDGTMTDPEWCDANNYAITLVRNDGAETISATVYFKHDYTDIYIGLKLIAEQHDNDKFMFFFDEGNDGAHGSGTHDGALTHQQEDMKEYATFTYFDTHISDGYFFGTHMWTSYHTEIDFDCECIFAVDHWELEFRIPFVGNDSGTTDISDLVCSPTDTIGIKIQYFKQPGDWLTGNYFYPAGDLYAIETYTTLSFMILSGAIPEVPLGTIVASATMIIALAAHIAMPKLRKKPITVNP